MSCLGRLPDDCGMTAFLTIHDVEVVTVSVVAAACGLAAAMGLGRFVYTPLMPLMIEQTALSPQAGAWLATANYLGYFLGAVVLMRWPRVTRRATHRGALVVIVITELAMVGTESVALWSVARVAAGVASAFVFVYCARAVTGAVSPGVAYSGVGLGILLSGLLSLSLQTTLDWKGLWLVAAAITALLSAVAWWLRPAHRIAGVGGQPERWSRDGVLLTTAYSLEGLGYIIVGTFLVALVREGLASDWAGPLAWSVVGLCALVSAVTWDRGRRWFSLRTLLIAALLLQCVAALIPVVLPGLGAAVVSGVLYGGTFMGVVLVAMTWGAELGIPSAAATLTVGYSIGQILGPLVIAPTLAGGYGAAFVIAAVVLLMAAGAALATGVAGRGDTSHPAQSA